MQRRGGNRINTRVSLPARAKNREHITRLIDLSRTGCKIDSSAWELAEGDQIVFAFSKDVSVAGKVSWRRGGNAGVHFDDPLPEAIARHLRFEENQA